ncbi:MAG: dihydroorotase [Bilophila sp.]
MSTLCIQNARYLGNLVDLLVTDGVIAALHPAGTQPAPAEAQVVDATGRLLFPSFIDAHTHLREPGQEWKETVASGLAAAAHGGFGAVMCMANTDPVNDDAAVTAQILEAGRRAWPHGPRVYPIGAATVGLKGEELACMHELAQAGCVAISNDGRPVGNTEMFRRVLEYATDLGLVVIDHCEDPYLARASQMNEGHTSGVLGLKGQPDVAETIQAARSILLAEYLDVPVHIAHVSARRTVDVIAWGKARGVRVSAETTPHYLTLDETAVMGYNTNAKVNPPLRTQADIAALRTAVKSGVIDMLATDHAPHAAHEKETPFDEAPNGFTGLDLALSVTYGLVREGVLTEADLIRLWLTEPARVFKLPANTFKPGDPADFFLFDPAAEWLVSPETLYSKSHNTPWCNTHQQGRVVAHWLGGVQVV